MANWPDPQPGMAAQATTTTVGTDVAYDAGLRSHMLSVYNYMTSGILLTGVVALLFSQWEGAPVDPVRRRASCKYADHVRAAGLRAGAELRHQPLSTGTAQLLFWRSRR